MSEFMLSGCGICGGQYVTGFAHKCPASPSGNRHDGVLLDIHPSGYVVNLDRDAFVALGVRGGRYVARPVDIDAARTAVIEAARGVRASIDDDEDGQVAAFCRLDEAFTHLDALTTKGATT